jgi:hypothetical protein
MATAVTTPLDHPLTKVALVAAGYAPLYLGDDMSFRFQLLDSAGDAVALTSALIVLSIEGPDGTVIERRSDTEITDGPVETNQIELDANQSTEVGDTGKGWYECFFSSADEDVTALTTVVGRGNYQIVVQLGDSTERTHLAGKIDVILGKVARPIEAAV